jgi:hypothetical protein
VPHHATDHAQPALDEPSHRQRVDAVLGGQHAVGQGLGIVVGSQRHHRLQHDRPMVQFGCDEVHRGAAQLAAGLDGALVRVQPREGRQQRRVDVEQPALEAAHEALAEDAHEAGQHQQVRGEGIDGPGQRVVESLARGEVLVRHDRSGDAVRGRKAQAGGVGAVGDHRHHACRPALGRTALHDRLHVGAASGDQDHDGLHRRQCSQRPSGGGS